LKVTLKLDEMRITYPWLLTIEVAGKVSYFEFDTYDELLEFRDAIHKVIPV